MRKIIKPLTARQLCKELEKLRDKCLVGEAAYCPKMHKAVNLMMDAIDVLLEV
jgi:hypothetical protein